MRISSLLITAFALLVVLTAPSRAADELTIDEDDIDDPAAIERERDPPVFDGHTEYGEPSPEDRHAPPPPPWTTSAPRNPDDDWDPDDAEADDHWTTDEDREEDRLDETRPRDREAPGYDDEHEFDRAPAYDETPGERVERGLDRAGAATRRSMRGVADPVGRGLDRAMKGTGRGLHKAMDATGKGLHKAGDAVIGEPPEHDAE